jgi:hypothetical protein
MTESFVTPESSRASATAQTSRVWSVFVPEESSFLDHKCSIKPRLHSYFNWDSSGGACGVTNVSKRTRPDMYSIRATSLTGLLRLNSISKVTKSVPFRWPALISVAQDIASWMSLLLVHYFEHADMKCACRPRNSELIWAASVITN